MSKVTVKNTRKEGSLHLGPKYGALAPGECREVDGADLKRVLREGIQQVNELGQVIGPPRKAGKAGTAAAATEAAEPVKVKQPVNAGK